MAKGDFVLVDEGYSEFDETSRDTGDSVLGSNEEERFWGITSSKSSVQITEVRHRSPPAAVSVGPGSTEIPPRTDHAGMHLTAC